MPLIGPLELLLPVVFLLFWVVPSFLVAKYAERNGQNFVLFLLLGLATSFVISWIIAIVVIQSAATSGGGLTFFAGSGGRPGSAGVDGSGSSPPGDPQLDQLSRLERLERLRQNGTLTDEEFAAQKAVVLAFRP